MSTEHAPVSREKYNVIKRFVDFIFTIFAALAIFDFAADTYMFTVIQEAVTDYEGILDSIKLNPPSCLCYEDKSTGRDRCETPLDPGSSPLCTTLSNYNYSRSLDKQCNLYGYVSAQVVNNSVSSFTLATSSFETQLLELKSIRTSVLAFLVIAGIITLVYLYSVVLKRRDRIKLLPRPLDVERENTAEFEDLTAVLVTGPAYAGPPKEAYPGKPAAPTFWVEAPTMVIEQPRAPVAPPAPVYQCSQCGNLLPDNNPCPDCAQRIQADSATNRRSRMRQYFVSFAQVAQARLLMLVFVDMPQSILIVLYIVSVDAPDGLYCRSCASDGEETCKFGDDYNKAAVILSILGSGASIALLFIQVIYVQQITIAENNRQPGQFEQFQLHGMRVFGMDLKIALVIIPAVICPVLVTILVTDMRTILAISKTSEIVLAVFAAVCGIPWLGMLGTCGMACAELCDYAFPGCTEACCPCCDASPDANCCDFGDCDCECCADCCESIFGCC